jgi:ABC-type Fe3+/spermidine/putrescine transport system ATPase subunit
MRGELIEMHRPIQKTLVYVTHDQLEAMTRCSDRIAIMSHGKLQQFGTADEVYHRSENMVCLAIFQCGRILADHQPDHSRPEDFLIGGDGERAVIKNQDCRAHRA